MRKSGFMVTAALLAGVFLPAWTGCENVAETLLVGDHDVPYQKLGINMFPRNRSTGDLESQMRDIKDLGINTIRVTFWFDSQYMPTLYSSRDFSQFDEVMDAAEATGIEVVPILAYVPDWLWGVSGWESVFIDQYVKPVVSRYRDRVNYWEIWNEPDENSHYYGVLDGSAEDYYNLLAQVAPVIRSLDPTARIITAATANVVEDGLAKYEWTKRLLELGAARHADILNIHYYSSLDIELSAVVAPLVQGSGMSVWVTETGKAGQSKQLDYFEQTLPYIDKSLDPERIYWYCYVQGAGRSETKHPDDTYGLVTAWGGGRTESPLYTHLKNR